METIKIHGKDYVTVSERVKWFRLNKEFAAWSIVTELINFEADIVIMKASILDQEGGVISTGHAYEKITDKGINQTSHLENAETSAVGRSLAFLGLGIDGGIASIDEILSARQYEYIEKLMMQSSISQEDRDRLEMKLTTMTTKDAEDVIKYLQSHQLDPIESGMNYKQGDIQKKLDKIDKDPKK